MAICEHLTSVEFVSESLRVVVRFLALRNHHGSSERQATSDKAITYRNSIFSLSLVTHMAVITDPIGDMLIRIKNAYNAKKDVVVVPHSKIKEEIAKLLEARGFIQSVEKKGKKVRKFLELSLKYGNGAPALQDARRISKPSRRLYTKSKGIRPVRHGHGMVIVSTSGGLMAGEEAKVKKLGGEIIAEIW